jgi:hypothetical protein
MISIVAVQPTVILRRQYLFSPQIEPYIFFFWENMTYHNKKYPFSIEIRSAFAEIFAKENTARVISYRDKQKSPDASSSDRRERTPSDDRRLPAK